MPSLMAILGLDGSRFSGALDKAKSEARSAGKEITSALGEEVMGALVAIGSIAAVEHATKEMVEYGTQISITAQRLGMLVEDEQAWALALKKSGADIHAVTGFFEKLATSREKALAGDAKQVEAFRRLGVSIEDLKNKRIEQIGEEIAGVFESGDPQKLIGDLREVGGRGAGELVAAFRDGLAGAIAEHKNSMAVMDEETVSRLRRIHDFFEGIWDDIKGFGGRTIAYLEKGAEDLWHDFQQVGNAIVGFVTGGPAGAKALMEEYDKAWKEREEEQRAREQKRNQPLPGGGEEMDNKKKARQEEERHAERIARLQEELKRKQDAASLAAMSGEERLYELMRRRDELLKLMGKSQTEEGKLNLQMDIADLDREIEEASNRLNKKEPARAARAGGPHVNQLQAIGAFAAAQPLDMAALRVHEKNEHHLSGIHEGIQHIKEHLQRGAHF